MSNEELTNAETIVISREQFWKVMWGFPSWRKVNWWSHAKEITAPIEATQANPPSDVPTGPRSADEAVSQIWVKKQIEDFETKMMQAKDKGDEFDSAYMLGAVHAMRKVSKELTVA